MKNGKMSMWKILERKRLDPVISLCVRISVYLYFKETMIINFVQENIFSSKKMCILLIYIERMQITISLIVIMQSFPLQYEAIQKKIQHP